MIVGMSTGPKGQRVIILGVTRQNVERLIDGKPIYVTAEHHPGFPTDLQIAICFGETEREITEELRPLIGEETKVVAVPKPADRPKGVS
jgi:hypothetical protein